MSVSLETMPTFAPKFNGWTILVQPIDGGGEQFDLPARVAIVDPSDCGPELARAHVVAHLSLNHHLNSADGTFTEQQEQAADIHSVSMLKNAVAALGGVAAAAYAFAVVNTFSLQKVAFAALA